MLPEQAEKKVLDFLAETDEALPIDKIAKRLRLHRVTVSKYLQLLEAKGRVDFRPVGKAKIYFARRGAEAKKTDFRTAGEGWQEYAASESREPQEKAYFPGIQEQAPRQKSRQYRELVALARKLVVIDLLRKGRINMEQAIRLSGIPEEKLRGIAGKENVCIPEHMWRATG